MLPHHWLVLALGFAFVVGAFIAFVILDATLFLGLDHNWTFSHAMFLLGETHRWLPWVWTVVGLLFVIGFRIHFWGR